MEEEEGRVGKSSEEGEACCKRSHSSTYLQGGEKQIRKRRASCGSGERILWARDLIIYESRVFHAIPVPCSALPFLF